jgi:hypothetical protein
MSSKVLELRQGRQRDQRGAAKPPLLALALTLTRSLSPEEGCRRASDELFKILDEMRLVTIAGFMRQLG